MTTLETIKKQKDKYCTKYVIREISLIKKHFKIKPNKRVFYFDTWCRRDYFFCDNKVFIARFDINKNKTDLIFSSLYTAVLKENDVEFETVIPDDTKPKFEELFNGKKIDITRKLYTKEEFLCWLDSPCCATETVDISYREAIKFLQDYKKDTFKTENYLFYVKRDKDYTWADNFYAYDIKNQAEMKMYFCSFIQTFLPERSRDIFIEDLSGKLSKYQLNKCKKEFMIFMKKICPKLKIENFYALEFVKQCIQPIEKDRGWFVRLVFPRDYIFNIWVDDVLLYDKKPYFVITEGNNEWLSTRAAAIDFFKPEYKSTKPYISGCYKRNHWDIDENTLKNLTEFLKKPVDYSKMSHCSEEYKKEIKTNWEMLISEYNANLFEGDEELPLDLPMPDYTKLIK